MTQPARRLLATAVLLVAPAAVAPALHAQAPTAPATARDSVLATVDAFFRAMSAHDTAGTRAVLLADGQLYAVQQTADSVRRRRTTGDDFLGFVGRSPEALLERVWEPTVLVHDPIAVVWARYDFHRAGRFSHCGVDAFTLVRSAEGWKIAGIAYTVEPQGCAPSPLGPPVSAGR